MKRWGPYMMKQPMVWLLAALALSPLVAAESLYVHSAKASLLAAPKFNADILVSVEKGAELVLIEQQKRWFLVQFDDQTGWVSSLLVKSAQIFEIDKLLLSNFSKFKYISSSSNISFLFLIYFSLSYR